MVPGAQRDHPLVRPSYGRAHWPARGSPAVIYRGSYRAGRHGPSRDLAVFPFALLASIGRGYLLPMGLAVLVLMATNLVAIAGWGEYYPWAVPGLYAQGKSVLAPVSYWIVIFTGLAGMFATYLWWKYADQSR